MLPTQFKICLLYSVWTSRGAKHSFAKSQCGCKEWLAHMQAFFALVRETESYIDRHHYSIYIRVALSEGPSYVATLSSISWFLLIWLNEAAIISDLHSMKWLGEFLLLLRWDGRPLQVLPLTLIIRSQCLPKNGLRDWLKLYYLENFLHSQFTEVLCPISGDTRGCRTVQ